MSTDNLWFNVKSIDGDNWCLTNDRELHFKSFLWITTTRMCDIRIDGNRLSGFSMPLARFEFYMKDGVPQKGRFWNCTAWVVQCFLDEALHQHNTPKYTHFKINDSSFLEYPPIPEFLLDIYLRGISDE